MEFKKKTIIWEDNNEPPKDYIGAKKDGKFYEYSYATRSWIESKLLKAEESGGSDDSSGGSQEELDFINQAVNIIKSSPDSIPMSINYWNDVKTEIPFELEKIGDENNADYVFISHVPNPDTHDVNHIALFLTEDEFNIVWNMTIVSAKSYLKGYITFNDDTQYNYHYESNTKYLNFDFVFLLTTEANETLVLDDVDVTQLYDTETDSSGYIKIYVPYTEQNNNFLFKINNATKTTTFTKTVIIDTEHPVEVNGVNYYPVVLDNIG